MVAPDLQIYSEPTARTYQTWTPGLLQSAEILADSGQLMLAAQLCEAMLGDDRVKAVVDTRTDALLGLPLHFDPPEGRKGTRQIRALELQEDWYDCIPETELKLLHAWGIILGVGLAELQWVPKGKRIIPRLSVRSPRFLWFDWLTRTWKLWVADGMGGQKEIEIRPGDGKWLLYTPYGSQRPWIYGAYRALSRWSLLKSYAIQDWGFYSERHGQGILVAEGADGSKEQRKQIVDDLKSLGRNAALAIPKGFSLKLVEAVAKTYETFEHQIAAADNGTAVTLLGQNLTTEMSAGSHAAATVHGRVALGRTKSDAETLSTTIYQQALRWWALFNFGSADLSPWPVWDTTPTADVKEEAAAMQMLAQAISTLAASGAPIDIAALCERYRIPLKTIDDPMQGALYKYHFDYGVVTLNEARARLGLPPVDGGNVPPLPLSPVQDQLPTDQTTQ